MQELTRQDAERILARNHHGRLAVYSPSQDTSYIVPMSYAYRDGSIYFGTLSGRKLTFLREHPRGVCFEVDEITNDETWLSVIATGAFEEVQGPEREEEVASAIERALRGPLRTSLYTDNIQSDWQRAERQLHICALRITDLTARQDRWSWDVDFPKGLERAKEHSRS
ncbi:MAG TPA: pyridoxamine 5'-phosphate oxidase family protein [Chloroflexota bacterium]|nr:pyridoxamine 5'-phosphate oxidase family protein [Chloroflexota bacterium]